MHRREFAKMAAGTAASSIFHVSFAANAIAAVQKAMARGDAASPEQFAANEDAWRDVKQSFSASRSMINLDNGNVCPSPKNVTEAMMRSIWFEQEAPAYSIYEVELPQTIDMAKALAAQFGSSLEEIAIVRNATEALTIVLMGVELKAGDEILTTTHDYWAMQEALDQRALREGIVVKRVGVPAPAPSMEKLVEIFERAITPRTRLILLSHPVNLTGQFFPVKQICEMAHARNIEVCVDGAQGFAHMDFKRDDLGCDYFGTSLHKWLLAPIGTGMLYIKKEKIGKVWPLIPAPPEMRERMLKFMHWGTFSPAPFLAISDAIAFHAAIGGKRKEERLRYLTSYWVKRLQGLPRIKFLTSFSSPQMSCGLATFQLDGIDATALQRFLLHEHSIVAQSVTSRWAPEIQGIRVTPNLYTSLDELDRFCDVVESVAAKGLPASR